MSKKPAAPRTIDPKAQRIGERIKAKRKHLGFTAAELAAKIGRSENAVTQYETGRAIPMAKVMETLAESLETTVTWLLTGDDPDEVLKAQTKNEKISLEVTRSIPLERQADFLAVLKKIAEAFIEK